VKSTLSVKFFKNKQIFHSVLFNHKVSRYIYCKHWSRNHYSIYCRYWYY